MAVQVQSGGLPSGFLSGARGWLRRIDRAAWRRFFVAVLALTLALFLALYATGLSQSGQYKTAAVAASVSLLLAALVAVRVVPGLARRTALQHWMRGVEYEFTPEGAVYLALILIITVAAVNTGNNLLFIILSCLLAGILVSGVMSRIVLQGLELELTLPDHLFAGQPVFARLRLKNQKQFLPTFSVTVQGRASLRLKRGRHPLLSAPAILSQDVYIPYLPRRSAASPDLMLTFPKRGSYSQESFRVSTRFPFGFIRKTRSIPCGREVLVLPSVEPSEAFFEVLPQLGSEMDSYVKGRSHDLYAIRDYRPSDSARHVDWKATARVRQLKVREFTREDQRRLRLVLDPWVPDTSAKMLERFENSVTLCACLAWYFYETGVEMAFVTDGFEVPMSPPSQILYPVLEKLAVVEPAPVPASSAGQLISHASAHMECFQVIITHQPPESIPASQRRSSYFIFMDLLSRQADGDGG
ncbi:MAG TPA: DUF58 domain-containing protein [Terriglobia bacterium]|nr:DUF58 domain-containing protein [Terriglobia bacterium]